MSDILDLPWSVARAQVSPREYVDASLRAIAAGNEQLHAFLADPSPDAPLRANVRNPMSCRSR